MDSPVRLAVDPGVLGQLDPVHPAERPVEGVGSARIREEGTLEGELCHALQF